MSNFLPAILTQLLRSRWFAGLVLAGLVLLLYLTVSHLDGKAPGYQEVAVPQSTPVMPVPVSRLSGLFERGPIAILADPAKQESGFHTRHFGPAPAPPPPTTRTFELTYLGFYSAAGATRQVMVRMGDGFFVAPLGERALSNLFVAEATMQELVLTNNTGQTNRLPLNKTKPVEVPIK
jgi:hypothetical protein